MKNKFSNIIFITGVIFGIFVFGIFNLGVKDTQAITNVAEATWQCYQGVPRVTLTWNEHFGATSYYIKKTIGGSWSTTVRAPQTFYTRSGEPYGTYNQYTVKPNNEYATQNAGVVTGSCVAVTSFTGPTNVTAGSSATYNASFAGGSFIGTQIYVKNPAGSEFWLAGGSNNLSGTYTFPTVGIYSVCADAWVNDSNPAPGSVITDRECKTVDVTDPPTYTVSTNAGTGGYFWPSSRTGINSGDTTTFNVWSYAGYDISSVSGCSGSLSGTTYTTGAIYGNCTVYASFAPSTPTQYTVTGTAGANGSISPATQEVDSGDQAILTVTPNSGYQVSGIGDYSGSMCDGSLSGNTFWTGQITDDCTVTVYFSLIPPTQYLVSTSAGSNGSISPSYRWTNSGSSATFTVSPNSGYTASASGCSGSLSGTTYTTGAITSACTVTASFSLTPLPDLTTGTISPSSATAGVNTSYSATITNGGSASTGSSFNTLFQFDNDSNHSSVNATSVVSTSSIASGGTSSSSASHPFSSGTRYVRACADNNDSWVGTIAESDENNNCGSWTTITVSAAPAPDLTAGNATPTSATAGTPVTLSASITNSGNASTGASFSNFFQVATSPNGGGTITGLGATTMSTLASSASSNTTKSYTFPSNGSYSIRACADKTSAGGGGVISESNENNNCGSWRNVVVNAAPPTTYTVTGSAGANGSISPSSRTVTSGNTTTFTVTPNSGYTASASGCSGSLSGTTYTTGAITSACTVSASFTVITTSTISVNPSSIATRDSSTLSWSSNGTSCSGENFDTGGNTTGSIPITPNSTTTYILTCEGEPTTIDEATVTVKKKPIFIEN